jgi:predicted RNA-binding protein associated with RNAse of E/G family
MSTRQLKRQHNRAQIKQQEKQSKNPFLRDRFVEVVQLVASLQVAQEATLQALISKGLISHEDFRQAVVTFNRKLNEAQAQMRAAEAKAKDEHAASIDEIKEGAE